MLKDFTISSYKKVSLQDFNPDNTDKLEKKDITDITDITEITQIYKKGLLNFKKSSAPLRNSVC